MWRRLRFNLIVTLLGLFSLVMTVVTCRAVFGADESHSVTDNFAYTIVIDAGHGGIDGGVTGAKTGVRESDLNLKVALELQTLLLENGFNVVMTRTGEGGLYGTTDKGFKRRDMLARKAIISKAKADLVVSVHMNFYSASYRHGAQVFYQSGSSNEKNFAEIMQLSLNKKLSLSNLCLSGDFFICRESQAPAVIVECGFLSNADDEKLLLTASYRKLIAKAIMEGCVAYLFS